MPKIYVSPAMHRWNPCFDGVMDETTENNEYCDILVPMLEAQGFEVKRGIRRTPKSSENGDSIMSANIKESNKWGADIHYVSHTNAANGRVQGYRPIIWKGSADALRLAQLCVRNRKEIGYPYPCQIDQRTDLAELRDTSAIAIYHEHCFHDNADDDMWFRNHYKEIAEADTKALCEYFGIEYKEPFSCNGWIDDVDCNIAKGWVYSPQIQPLEVEMYANGNFAGKCIANHLRGDVMDAGYGDGYCGYECELFGLEDGKEYTLEAYAVGGDKPCFDDFKFTYHAPIEEKPIEVPDTSEDTPDVDEPLPEKPTKARIVDLLIELLKAILSFLRGM